MITPNNSQRQLQTITQWRYCSKCDRSTPQRKIAGDTLWQCPWCGCHDTKDEQPAEKGASSGQ
jgi:ribosomal protein L37AE/L43A